MIITLKMQTQWGLLEGSAELKDEELLQLVDVNNTLRAITSKLTDESIVKIEEKMNDPRSG